MLTVLKIGGNVIDNPALLQTVLQDFAQIEGGKILVHGGGKIASELSKKMGIVPQMVEGRRITDEATIDVVTMVYAGLLNKKMVAQLQKNNCNALGLSGADANVIQARKRPVKTIDYGFVGDLDASSIQVDFLKNLLENGITPVFSAITHDKNGLLLNTNADTIASSIARAMAQSTETRLIFCFEKKGVLLNIEDENSFIPEINFALYQELKSKGIIFEGMIPKLDNAFESIAQGVKQVILCNPENILTLKEKTVLA